MSEIVRKEPKAIDNLKAKLNGMKVNFASVLPKHLNAERMIKLVLAQASRNPMLLKCTPASILTSVMISSQLGLEPDGTLGGAYLIPYKNNKTGYYEAQFQIGYRGLIDLARRSGHISSIESHVVYENDDFKCTFGLDTCLRHERNFKEKPGNIIAVYAIARFKDGGVLYEVMTKDDVDIIRARSKARNNSPWETDYSEMARKTVVKRLCKYLPLSVELSTAINVDNAIEKEDDQTAYIDIDGEVINEITANDYSMEDEPKSLSVSDHIATQLDDL